MKSRSTPRLDGSRREGPRPLGDALAAAAKRRVEVRPSRPDDTRGPSLKSSSEMMGPRTAWTQPRTKDCDPPKKKIETDVPMRHEGSDVGAAGRAEGFASDRGGLTNKVQLRSHVNKMVGREAARHQHEPAPSVATGVMCRRAESIAQSCRWSSGTLRHFVRSVGSKR